MNSKHKFLLIFFILGVLTVTLIKVFEAHSAQLTMLKSAISHSYKINSDVLLLRKNEKNFLTRLSWDEIKKFNANAAILENNLTYLSQLLKEQTELQDELAHLRNGLKVYQRDFEVTSQCYERIGIDFDHGLKGRLKQDYIKIETFIWQLETQEFAFRDLLEPYHHQLLKLSYSEKNFLLKPCHKYVDRFKSSLDVFVNLIDNDMFLDTGHKKLFIQMLTDYAASFYALSDAMLMLDQSPDSPLVALAQSARELEFMGRDISGQIVDRIISSEKGSRTYSTVMMLSFAFGLLSIALVPFLLLMTSNRPSWVLIDEKV
ncbi:MAG: hypothetical protein FJ161_00440 [Gammaproteobacteria bacterium]|nr:hypothetical protein [Gammaproteobacteria bacterium]